MHRAIQVALVVAWTQACSGSSLHGVECFSGVDSCHQWFSWSADDSIWWDLTWSLMCCFPLCWTRSRQEQCKSDRRCGGLSVRGGQAVGTNEQAHRTTRAKGCLETDGPWYFRTDWMAGSGFCFYRISAVCYLDVGTSTACLNWDGHVWLKHCWMAKMWGWPVDRGSKIALRLDVVGWHSQVIRKRIETSLSGPEMQIHTMWSLPALEMQFHWECLKL